MKHVFWYQPETIPTFVYPSGWMDRIAADARRHRIARWGQITWERGPLARRIESALDQIKMTGPFDYPYVRMFKGVWDGVSK